MYFGKIAALLLLLCVMTHSLFANTGFAELTEFVELKDLEGKEHEDHEPINVLFTYSAPKKFARGDKLFLYFFIVDLTDDENIKTHVRKITKPKQTVQEEVHLKSTELVYVFVFSKKHPFASFKRSDVGFLKINIDQRSNKRLNFEEYDPRIGGALFDPFHIQRLNPSL